MKKSLIVILSIFIFLFSSNIVKAESACEIDTVKQVAKILYHEVGSGGNSENFFRRLGTASVIVNHTTLAPHNTGSLYERILAYTDKEYQGYSTYKNKSFENVIPAGSRGELLYVSALVLSGKFNFPKEVQYQAAEYILKNDGAHEFTHSGTVYFGYSRYVSLSSTDVFGNSVPTDPDSFRSLAKTLEQEDYSIYNSNDVCNLVANINGSGGTISGGNSSGGSSVPDKNGGVNETPGNIQFADPTQRLDYTSICANDNIRQAFKIIGTLINLIKIIVPLMLIIFGMIDLGKAIVSSDDKAISKAVSTLVKRFIAAVTVFFIPTVMMVLLEFIQVSQGITSETDPNFGKCTKCMFDPFGGECQ